METKILFALKIEIERPFWNPRGFQDLLDTRVVKPFLVDNLRPCSQDLLLCPLLCPDLCHTPGIGINGIKRFGIPITSRNYEYLLRHSDFASRME